MNACEKEENEKNSKTKTISNWTKSMCKSYNNLLLCTNKR